MRLSGAITKMQNGQRMMAKPVGLYSLTDNVYLRIKSETAGSWLFIGVVNGKRREIGLGSARFVSKDEAREAGEKVRAQIRARQDPLTARAKALPAPTFAMMLDSYLAKEAHSWKGTGTEKQWRQQLSKHCAALMSMPVDQITTDTVLSVLKPIWKQSLGGTQRLRIETVLDHAKVKLKATHQLGDNPAAWDKHLEHMLAAPVIKGAKNFPSLPWAQANAFLNALGARKERAALALAFVMFTAGRANEACKARWSEIDLAAGIWTIPGDRMKAGVAHIVPLSRQAVALLTALPRNGEFVFSATKDPRKPINNKLMNELIERMGLAGQATPHGFRATFRNWANAQTRADGSKRFDGQDLEFCLAHKISDKVEAAYLTETATERRAIIMQAWADFATRASNVVQLRGVA